MALSEAIVAFNVHELLGGDFDVRRTRVYATVNVENGTLNDTSTGETRMGNQTATIASDGTGTLTTWTPGSDGNPTSWQTSIHFDYARAGTRDRTVRTFGPYTITGTSKGVTNKALTSNVATLTTDEAHGLVVGNTITVTGVDATFNITDAPITAVTSTTVSYAVTHANVSSAAASGTLTSPNVLLTSLEEEQAIPAEYVTQITEVLDTIADEAAASAAEAQSWAEQAEAITGLPTSDAAFEAMLRGTAGAGSLSRAALADYIGGYDIILVAGQSNAVGADNTSDGTVDVTDSRIFEYALSGTNANTIQPASDPLHHAWGTAATVGPAMPFARWYAAKNPTRKVLIVPCALGSSGFEASTSTPNGRWKVGRVQAGEINLYDATITNTNAALTAAGPGSRPVAMIWCQGEADGATSSGTYTTDLDALIDGFRANITGASKTPFLLLSMVPGSFGNSARVTINAVHVDTPYRKEYCGYTLGLSGHDNTIHYDAIAQRYNGSWALALAYTRALTNRIGVAPVAPTNVVVAQDYLGATTATVTWNAATGRVTDYTVQYRLGEGESWTTLTRSRSLDLTAQITGLTIGNYLQVRVLTVNEIGNSDPSATAQCSLLPSPNLSISQDTVGEVDLSVVPISGAIGYRYDYKLSSVSTWTAGTTGTGTTTTITGLTTNPYDFRVVAFTPYGSVAGTASSFTPTATALDPAGLTGTVYQAYGLRKVLSTYSGNVIRVRRSSDNTEQDIGIASGTIHLDTAALLTFCGAGDGFITKWYDQSGSARDMLQATTANQPKIVSAGVVLANNGRPGVQFDGSTSYIERTTADLYSGGAATVCGVASGTPSTNLQECVLGEGGTGSNNARYMILKCTSSGTAAKFGYNIIGDASSSDVLSNDFTDLSGSNTFGTTATQWVFVDTGTSITRYRGGSVVTSGFSTSSNTYSRSGKTLTLNRQAIGALHRTAVTTFATMRLSELIIFRSAVSSGDRTLVQTNQQAYYGTPTGL